MTQPVKLPEHGSRLASALFIAVPVLFAVWIAYASSTGHSLSPMSWNLSRAAGITLYLLFWGMVMTGLLLTTRIFDRMVSKATLLSLHGYVGRLAYAFLAAHLLSLVIDQHLPFTIDQLVVPFGGPTGEPWTGFGILGMYLFIVVIASASWRRYIPYAVWRFLHVLAFPMYALSLLHGIGAGSSTGAPIMQAIYLLTGAGVVVLCLVRLAIRNPGRQPVSQFSPQAPFDRFGGQTKLPQVTSERHP
jgi:predicted ferric reductase